MTGHIRTDMLCYIAYNQLCCSFKNAMHSTSSQADAAAKNASGLLSKTKISAVHSEQEPCTLRALRTLLTYGVDCWTV